LPQSRRKRENIFWAFLIKYYLLGHSFKSNEKYTCEECPLYSFGISHNLPGPHGVLLEVLKEVSGPFSLRLEE
jgi:hypothetical protein